MQTANPTENQKGKEKEKSTMADNKQIAKDVLAAVGGKENVSSVTHCMTRLRFVLKDGTVPNDKEIGKLDGVLRAQPSGGQYQVIIGQNVAKVYAEICAIGGFSAQAAIDENLDAPKQKLTPKVIGKNIMGYLSSSMVQMIPVMMAAGLIRTLLAVLGPDFFGIITPESDTYILLDFLYNSAFYFMPVFLGFVAAKHLGLNQMLGAYMGAILIAPAFIAIAQSGQPFTVFGIPCVVNDYSQSILPIFLSIWVMSYVYKLIAKFMPDTLSTIFTPFLTMIIMTPISLCALAPLGSILGTYISQGLWAFGDVGGFLGVALIGALWQFLVMTGMHQVILMFMLTEIMTTGIGTGVCVAPAFATFAAFGVALGAFLRVKDKKEKSDNLGFFISGVLGGVTEPTMYGICFKYKRPFIAMVLGGFVGGMYAGLTNVCSYVVTSTNILALMAYVGGGTANLVNGVVACLLSMAVAAVSTYLFGFSKADLEG